MMILLTVFLFRDCSPLYFLDIEKTLLRTVQWIRAAAGGAVTALYAGRRGNM